MRSEKLNSILRCSRKGRNDKAWGAGGGGSKRGEGTLGFYSGSFLWLSQEALRGDFGFYKDGFWSAQLASPVPSLQR